MRRRGSAVAIPVALAGAIAIAGCGVGEGEEVGTVDLLVTRDYGSKVLVEVSDEAVEADTVLRVLDRHAQITTRYGGGFVESIEGLAGESGGDLRDWFFYVNGVESPIGSADRSVGQGDVIWWDHHDWTAVMRVPAVVGSYPQPFRSGYEGERHPTAVVCRATPAICEAVEERLGKAGARLADGSPPEAIRVLVGPWAALREDPAARLIEGGPDSSGVFGRLVRAPRGWTLVGLDAQAKPAAGESSGAGLLAAVRLDQKTPTWLVTGTDARGVRAAVGALDEDSLEQRFALAVVAGRELPLPVPPR